MAYWKFIFQPEISNSFTITFTLVRQKISLKKSGSAISKIYCLISWSPICTLLILASASMKMASTSIAVIYNSIESGRAWWTPHVKVKGSDRRSFTLVLDWILCTQLQSCEWICLHSQTYKAQNKLANKNLQMVWNPNLICRKLWENSKIFKISV